MELKRLFDLIPHYQNQEGNKDVLYDKVNGQWTPLSIDRLEILSDQLAVSFLKKNINPNRFTAETQDKVAIISENRSEWVIIDFASQKTGTILIPIYPSISLQDLKFIIEEAQVKILFISNKKLYKKLKDAFGGLDVYSLDTIEDIPHYSELFTEINADEKKRLEEIKEQINEDTISTIIYTSGTTGNPKGVMLSHKNILSNVKNSFHCFDFCSSDGRMLSFLPLNHIFERMVLYLYLTKGVSIYFAESMEKIGDNLREVKPHIFTTVPRLLEKVYERIETKGNELKGISKRIFTWAMKLALKYELKNRGIVYNIQLALADKLVYKKWREAIGGEVLAIVTGSAACQIKLIRAFTAARIIIMEGYGLTETSPVISVNTFEAEGRRFGTVGRQIKNVEVKISEDGEIVFKGDNVMYGYYKNPEATAEVLMNGWLHTGDIGQMDEEGFIRITDRKKELFKMSSGKYIAPLPLENKIKESPYIEQIMVVGSNEKYVGALIVPSLHNVRSYFNRQGILLEDDMDIAENVEVKKLIRGEIDEYNKEFADHERVKRFELLAEEWSIDRGEMTPKLSLKRKVVTEKYKFLIDKIYNN